MALMLLLCLLLIYGCPAIGVAGRELGRLKNEQISAKCFAFSFTSG